MSLRREWLLILAVALVAAAAGYFYNLSRSRSEGAAGKSDSAVLLATTLPDLQGNAQTLDQWRGRVVVVNFWATWCAPCREEIPLFARLQDKYRDRGLQFVGIAIDRPTEVRTFVTQYRMNYPVLLGSVEAIELTRRLGNRAGVLPYSVVLARDGSIAAREIGAVKEAQVEALLASLL